MGLKPSADEVVRAIQSLYADQLKPFGRILRKRIAEQAVAEAANSPDTAGTCTARGSGDGPEHLPEVDIKHLRETCEAHEKMRVEPEEGGDWSAVLLDLEPCFVDIYSPEDRYPEEMWREAATYFESPGEQEVLLPGGRYSCAQALLARALPFFSGRTLGEICHIVQLAISKKKILGYSNGAVVPYSRSQSMIKERCAESQQPCVSGSAAHSAESGAAAQAAGATPSPVMPLADWETARSCLREILDAAAEPDAAGPASIPLSNVKRLFRSKYHLELSETCLGHSKLSELLQDERFSDVCTVQLQGHGYTVVQTQPTKAVSGSAISIVDGLFPGFSTSSPLEDTSLGGEPRRLEFCPDEPLCLEDAGLLVEGEPSGPLPFPTPSPSPLGASIGRGRWPAFALSPSTLLKDGSVGRMVQNTFIHAAPPPPTPPPGARQRASSLPKDVGSAKSEWETACHALGFMPRRAGGGGDSAASTADSSGSSALGCLAGPVAPLSPAPSSERDRLNTDGPSSPVAGAGPMKVLLRNSLDYQAPEPLQLLQPQPLEPLPDFPEDTVAPHRVPFCPDEPLSLEDAGIFIDRAPPGLSAVPEAPRWPMLSPSVRTVGSMIHNTFIGAPPTPITPAPGAARRSQSLPKDVGSGKGDWDTPRGAKSRAVGSERVAGGGYPPSLAASPGPAFVPPSPALTASPLPLYSTGGGYMPLTPPSPPHRVLRLADLL